MQICPCLLMAYKSPRASCPQNKVQAPCVYSKIYGGGEKMMSVNQAPVSNEAWYPEALGVTEGCRAGEAQGNPLCGMQMGSKRDRRQKVGVPVVAQWKQIRLRTMRFRVLSLASLSALRIWRCCDLLCSLQTWLGSGVAVAVA